MKYISTLKLVLILALLSFLAGCMATGKYTTPVSNPSYEVKPDKAMIVIMRPSTYGGAIASSLFDISGSDENLIGIIGPGEKVVHYADPGQAQLMVIAENADFLDATLEGGKIYYVIVTPRMGVWKARFSFHPFKVQASEEEFELGSKDMLAWLDKCKYVNANDSALAWAKKNATSIKQKRKDYMIKWDKMLEKDKKWKTLTLEDGVTALY